MALCWPLLSATADHGRSPGLAHGVVYYLPETPQESVRQLQAIRADGYNLIIISSWVWTVPEEGSALRRVVDETLAWCDENGMQAWLLHNIQWGSPGEGGDVEAALTDPTAAARRTLEPWARALQGHPCVAGVLLGNEVGPGGPELFRDHPRFLSAFQQWLQETHGDLETLNGRWGTAYSEWTQVRPPGAGEPGFVDVTRFLRLRFAAFYNAIVAQVLRPILGDKLYGSKGGASPYILRQMPAYSVCSWDDLLANWPLWKTKLLVDTTGLPVFNSELHLYHDDYEYNPSPELSRYRYFTSALLGEWMTASFSWGGWNKPQVARVHAATPGILADLRALEPTLRAFNDQTPAFSVLVTEGNQDGLLDHPTLEVAYAHAATTGLPWSFVADLNLDRLQAPVLVVDSPWLTEQAARQLVALAEHKRIIFVGPVPRCDEYGQPLPEALQGALARSERLASWAQLRNLVPGVQMPEAYREVVGVPYLWWSPERGHFEFPVWYPRLEGRLAVADGRTLVAVINHTKEDVTAPLAFVKPGQLTMDLLTGVEVNPSRVSFGPLAVRVFAVQQE